MRISDWSSDVCSSDLRSRAGRRQCAAQEPGGTAARDDLPACQPCAGPVAADNPFTLPDDAFSAAARRSDPAGDRSEEHTSELQSLMRISYAVFCLKKKKESTTKETAEHRSEEK